MPDSDAIKSGSTHPWPSRRDHKPYENIAIYRHDLPKLRELEHYWHESRVRVIHLLLSGVGAHPETRPIPLPLATWDRLDEVAHPLDLSGRELLARVAELVSQCTPEQLLSLLKDH